MQTEVLTQTEMPVCLQHRQANVSRQVMKKNPAARFQSLTSSPVLAERPPVSVAVTVTKYFPFSFISSPSVVLWKVREKNPKCSQIETMGPWAGACISPLRLLNFVHRAKIPRLRETQQGHLMLHLGGWLDF